MGKFKMSTKIKKVEVREPFRPKVNVQNINTISNYDPTYEYKNVIWTYTNDPTRVQRYEEAGWEVVYSTEKLIDDRLFVPNDKEDSLRPKAVTSKTKCGHQQVLMRCVNTRRAENEKSKKLERQKRSDAQVFRRGGSVERKGNQVITRDSEINENSLEI